MARHRDRWRVWQRYMDGERFVFLDETIASTNMVRLRGWGSRGERLLDATPHGHWRTTTPVQAGGRLFVPGLDPIEQLFAKLKALLQKAAARTRDALWDTTGSLLDEFAPAERQNCIINSGYKFV